MHRNLKASLRAKCTSASWTSELPLILLGLRSAPRESDAISSFEWTFGVPLISGDRRKRQTGSSSPSFSVPSGLARHPTLCPTLAVPDDLASCKFVLVRVDVSGLLPLAPLFSGPFLVLECYRSSFKLQVGTREEVVNISRLKPVFTPPDAEPVQPPK